MTERAMTKQAMNEQTDHQQAVTASERGFTLLELLVVIAIIIVVISIIIPALGGARTIARNTSTKSLMTQLSTAIGSYRNDHDGEMPGPFTQAELGDPNNAAFGLTAMENAMIDLIGANAVANGTNTITLDPTTMNPIDIGLDLLGTGDNVYFETNGSNFVAQLNQEGSIDKDMPDLVDAFGSPILLWAEDPGAPSTPTNLDDVAAIDSGSSRSRFYWTSNAAFIETQFLGKEQGDQLELSLLSSTEGQEAEAVAAITGDPSSPTPAGFTMANVLPAKSRGAFVLHSAGVDAVYLSKEDRGARSLPMATLQYRWNFFKADGSRLTDESDTTSSEDVLSRFNDLFVSGK